jgi:hypothetical protein
MNLQVQHWVEQIATFQICNCHLWPTHHTCSQISYVINKKQVREATATIVLVTIRTFQQAAKWNHGVQAQAEAAAAIQVLSMAMLRDWKRFLILMSSCGISQS